MYPLLPPYLTVQYHTAETLYYDTVRKREKYRYIKTIHLSNIFFFRFLCLVNVLDIEAVSQSALYLIIMDDDNGEFTVNILNRAIIMP